MDKSILCHHVTMGEFILIMGWASLSVAAAKRYRLLQLPSGPSTAQFYSPFLLLGAFVLFLFMQLAVPNILLMVYKKMSPANFSLDAYSKGWLSLIALVLSAVALWIYFALFYRILWTPVLGASALTNWKKEIMAGIAGWLICYPLVLLISALFELLFYLFSLSPPEDQTAVADLKQLSMHSLLFLLMASVISFLVPMAEELLFRGFLQGWLRNYMGYLPAILISSLLFASFHYTSDQGSRNIQIITALFFLSCALGFLKERQHSLLPCIALHVFFNGMSILFLWSGLAQSFTACYYFTSP